MFAFRRGLESLFDERSFSSKDYLVFDTHCGETFGKIAIAIAHTPLSGRRDNAPVFSTRIKESAANNAPGLISK